jgi:hypothetical protein
MLFEIYINSVGLPVYNIKLRANNKKLAKFQAIYLFKLKYPTHKISSSKIEKLH